MKIRLVHAKRLRKQFVLACFLLLACNGCGDATPPPLPTGGPGAKGSAEAIFRSMQKDASKPQGAPAAAKP